MKQAKSKSIAATDCVSGSKPSAQCTNSGASCRPRVGGKLAMRGVGRRDSRHIHLASISLPKKESRGRRCSQPPKPDSSIRALHPERGYRSATRRQHVGSGRREA
jgi:hypothetical protein